MPSMRSRHLGGRCQRTAPRPLPRAEVPRDRPRLAARGPERFSLKCRVIGISSLLFPASIVVGLGGERSLDFPLLCGPEFRPPGVTDARRPCRSGSCSPDRNWLGMEHGRRDEPNHLLQRLDRPVHVVQLVLQIERLGAQRRAAGGVVLGVYGSPRKAYSAAKPSASEKLPSVKRVMQPPWWVLMRMRWPISWATTWM